MPSHTYEKHEKCYKTSCEICEGGLKLCTVCKCAEAELTVDCPGTFVDDETRDKVVKELTDFWGRKWWDMGEPKDTRCSFHTHLGRYYLGEKTQQWQLVLYLPNDHTMTVLFPEDEEPDVIGLMPSEVAELIITRERKYGLSSRRGAAERTNKWVQKHAKRINAIWAENAIKQTQHDAARLYRRICELRSVLEEDEQ